MATLMLCGLLFLYFRNLNPLFTEVENGYGHNIVNLSSQTDSAELANLLLNNRYVKDTAEARLIADTLTKRLQRMSFPNLYHLQKRDYGQIPVRVADSLHIFEDRVRLSYAKLGIDDSVSLPSPQNLESTFKLSRQGGEPGDGEIHVHVFSESSESVGGIVVRLQEHYSGKDTVVSGHTVGYAKTDEDGNATFTGLDRNRGYSVLPIKKGYEYGGSKGIVEGQFDKYNYFGRFGLKEYVFEFKQLEHRIPMFNNSTLKQIKNDGTITVRTPEEFKHVVIKWFVLVLLAWWLLAAVMWIRKRNFDPVLLSAVMLLTGVCVLVMFAIQNPLTEELRGAEMGSGVLIGVGVMILFQFLDFVKLYQDSSKIAFDVPLTMVRWIFLPFKQKVSGIASVLSGYAPWYKKFGAMLLLVCCLPFAIFNIPVISRVNKPIVRWIERLPKGAGWLMLAIFLTALLWTPLGREIGGMKVNLSILGLVFQPSEIAKYLILLFMAAFFTQRADTIIAYSQPDRTKVLEKVKTLGWVIGGLLLLMAMYAALGDMGPALVIGVTFVLLYSLVKSKVNLDYLSDDDKWKRIFTCDFAVMIYGIVSFAVLTFLGYWWNGVETALFFAGLWFLLWIVMGILLHKQFFETAIIINLLVFTFVFGGNIAKKVPILRDTAVAERFDERTNMCTNTWGNLDVRPDEPGYEHGKEAKEVSNTQVANGLWAIATGGMTGQGMGEGNPNLIPAFHTDMILSSMAEQVGWVGLVLVVLVMALLLRRVVVVGYRVGHPFAFYFCMGVAIVTAVQFFIIALGSCGMIPLTGVTVPFLSYGRVSMILNLAAIGIVLSLSKNIRQEQLTEPQDMVRRRSVGDYNYPISIVTWCYVIVALFTFCVWQYYALWNRDDTLIRPAYVHSREGLPIIEYNPRIALLTSEMWAGNIYDRNGVLLATSDKDLLMNTKNSLVQLNVGMEDTTLTNIANAHTKRYYPFAEDMFFMLGDQNTGLYYTYNEDNPIGYMAEVQHHSYLRGYENSYNDKDGNPIKVKLSGKVKSDARFLNSAPRDTTIVYRLRDNRELVQYLKDGTHGKLLKQHNDKVKNGDYNLYLTLDAALQKYMQDTLENYVNGIDHFKTNNLLRISAVVLDAQSGDLLTSANYPRPDYQRLRDEDQAGIRYYNDNRRPADWKGYTDRDLGLTYATAPGSTAKVMSALAGLDKLGVEAVQRDARFRVYRYEVIDINKMGKSKEPPMGSGTMAHVSMKQAIVQSSNCYFINLVNHYNCYDELEKIYSAVGISLDNKKPYSLYYQSSNVLHDIVARKQSVAVPEYQKYITQRDVEKTLDTHNGKTLGKECWMWAWGQGTMDATPLNMARVVSTVANGGQMPVTRYLLKSADSHHREIRPEYVPITSNENAAELKSYLKAQADHKSSSFASEFVPLIGGKTGTPERVLKQVSGGQDKPNDGWYIMYVETGNAEHPVLAVAIRMERVGHGSDLGSGAAMKLASSVVLGALRDRGYVTQ